MVTGNRTNCFLRTGINHIFGEHSRTKFHASTITTTKHSTNIYVEWSGRLWAGPKLTTDGHRKDHLPVRSQLFLPVLSGKFLDSQLLWHIPRKFSFSFI